MSTKAGVRMTRAQARRHGPLQRPAARRPEARARPARRPPGLPVRVRLEDVPDRARRQRRALSDLLSLAHAGARHVPLPRHRARADRLRVCHRTVARRSGSDADGLARRCALCCVRQYMRLLTAAVVSLSALALAPAAALAAPPAQRQLPGVDPDRRVRPRTPCRPTRPRRVRSPTSSTRSRDGQPLGGGDPETTACNGVSFGKTVWYDFAPQVNYGVQLRASRLRRRGRGLRVEPDELAHHAAGRLRRQRGRAISCSTSRAARTTRSRSAASAAPAAR